MKHKNIVFIAKSIDGYIADRNGAIDWLEMIPNPDQNDMGYVQLMKDIDAIVMGRNSFETVLGFDIEWPYTKHVFVLSTRLQEIPEKLQGKVSILKGNIPEILAEIHQKGYNNLYIDGGKTVQHFLQADLVDELRITTLPILLGDGIPLFGFIPKSLEFTHVKTEIFFGELVQSSYERGRGK